MIGKEKKGNGRGIGRQENLRTKGEEERGREVKNEKRKKRATYNSKTLYSEDEQILAEIARVGKGVFLP